MDEHDRSSDSKTKSRTRSVWGTSPAGTTHAPGLKPGTKEFFEQARERRRTEELPFLHELVPFDTWKGKRVLELGCGVGFDAFDLCAAGCEYTGIDITPENPERTTIHLGFYGYRPKVMVADAEVLPFDAGSFDIVFSNGVLHHTPDMSASFREAYRVLKPGGEFWVILYHRHSIFHWVSLFLVQHLLMLGFLKMPFRDRLARIEFTTADEHPLVNVYSRSEVAGCLERAGFAVRDTWVRKLTPEDLPNLPVLRSLWRNLPRRWLDLLGRRWGWYVIARGVKV
jgi:SAM-dependent methyltransferase